MVAVDGALGDIQHCLPLVEAILMAAEPSRDTDRQSDLAVMDANEYKQKRRLERILDAMDNIPDQADRAKEQYFEGEINHHGRCVLVHDAVKDAIWEAWNLLVDHENKCQRRAEQAEDEEEPWPHSRYFVGHPDDEPLGIIEQSRDENIVVWGLREFFETDEMWVNRWEKKDKPRNGTVKTIPREETHTVPRDVSWAAALRLKEFLNEEHDMEIQFETMDDRRPYDDWREEFGEKGYTGPEDVDAPHKDV